MKKLQLLGNITPAQFLRDYWHKKPLLIRQAIPGFKPLLATSWPSWPSSTTSSRAWSPMVDGEWDMQHGPLEALPPRTQREWTMLVQGVNLSTTKADALLRQFRFMPDARLDDLMISYATMAAASVRISIPTTCSCCRRTAGAAGASARRRT
jgi:50S ribosomal protein L16 3-hydroxylase